MPQVSVVIPNWNGMRFIALCLESLYRSRFSDFEVLVIDNNSTDGSREYIQNKYPSVRLICLDANYGFARACNEGIHAAMSSLICLLNNDIEVDPDWLSEVYAGMQRHPECAFGTSRMYCFDQRTIFYNTGDVFHTSGKGGARGGGEKDTGQYDREEYVFGACAGAGVYRREFFQAVGTFERNRGERHRTDQRSHLVLRRRRGSRRRGR